MTQTVLAQTPPKQRPDESKIGCLVAPHPSGEYSLNSAWESIRTGAMFLSWISFWKGLVSGDFVPVLSCLYAGVAPWLLFSWFVEMGFTYYLVSIAEA